MSRARHSEKMGREKTPLLMNDRGSPEEHEVDEKKHGGRVKKKHGGKVEGHMGKRRMDRPGRKRGGAIGADQHPLSTAARTTPAEGHKTDPMEDD